MNSGILTLYCICVSRITSKYDADSISPRSLGSPSPLTTTKRTTPRSGSPGATDVLGGGCFERLNVG